MSKRKKPKKLPPPPPFGLEEISEEAFDEVFEEQLQELSKDLERAHIWGIAGGGLVRIETDAMLHVLQCQLAPELLEKKDRELIEDLVVSAINDAADKARAFTVSHLSLLWEAEDEDDDEDDEDEDIDPKIFLSQNKDLLEALGEPFITFFANLLSELSEEDPKPKRKK